MGDSKYLEVHGSRMHYVESGKGRPFLFLHGNPTSSYLWRNIIPHLETHGRCIAVDLIGMGKSDKPDLDYTFLDHYKYLKGFIEKLDLKDITLVVHDWGSGLGFHYSFEHPDNICKIAFMEAIVRPMKWSQFPPAQKPGFMMFRTPVIGFVLLSVFNMFLKVILPQLIVRKLTHEEMQNYLEPFKTVASRKAIRVWPTQIPIDGKPSEMHHIVVNYSEFLQKTDIPKLMLTVQPGAAINNETAKWCQDNFKNLETVHLGKGLHFVQEDHPDAIGKAIAQWDQRLTKVERT